MARTEPGLDTERRLAAGGARLLAGCDEVGRGAVAGVVSVGLVVVDLAAVTDLPGVADSKLLPARRRTELDIDVRAWALACAVGHASAAEVEKHGIVAALRLAGMRALEAAGVDVDVVLLDGSHDWLTPPAQGSLFDTDPLPVRVPPVHTQVRADQHCLTVAAASIIAKVERDRLMARLDERYPGYGFSQHAGYGTPGHLAACRDLGLTPEHRTSWLRLDTGS